MLSSSDPVLAAIERSSMKGLEIGPLTNPKVLKSEGDVRYLDHLSSEELREKYAPNEQLRATIEDLVHVDIVQHPSQTIAEAVGAEAPFDYVIAAHVIEHVPNMIGWLHEISSILKPDGILSLVIPDKRYTFDVNRTPTELSDVVDSHLRRLRTPSFRQVFDWFSRTVTIDGMVDTVGLWAGTIDYQGVVREDVGDARVHAYGVCCEQASTPSFLDIHCHVFTPVSFLAIYEGLVTLGLTDFSIAEFFATVRNTLEFHLSLRKLDGPDILSRQLASLNRAQELLTPPPPPALPSQVSVVAEQPELLNHSTMQVSGLEQRMILGKRRVLGAIRQTVSRYRRSG